MSSGIIGYDIITDFQNVNGTILHIGAGIGRELNDYLKTSADQIVLVEPNPDAAYELKQFSIKENRVKVIEAAVGVGENGTKLHRYNYEELATLHPHRVESEKWPGLQALDSIEVQILSLATLLGQITFTSDKKHWLIIEASGEEQCILNMLSNSDWSGFFTYLSIRIGSQISSHRAGRASFLRAIEEAGYRLEHIVANSDGHIYHSQRDSVQLALKNSNAEIERLKFIIKNLRAKQKKLESTLQSEKQASAKLGASSFSQDASIDNMIADIKPLFYGRSLNYVDVGAFIGEVFLKLSSSPCIKLREAHLIEPSPENYNKLIEKLGDSKISKIHTYNLAISAEPGDKILAQAKSMSKLVCGDDLDDNASNVYKVKSATLDSIKKYLTEGHINLLKLDVEGSELDVLRSGSSLLEAQEIDLIYIEVGFNISGRQQVYFCDIDKYLQERGYRVFGLYEFTNEWIEDLPLLRRCNALYISDKFSSRNHYKASLEIMQLKQQINELNEQRDD